MKASTTNMRRGVANVAAGKTKEIAGKVFRSPKLELKGKAKKEVGRVQRNAAKRQKARGE